MVARNTHQDLDSIPDPALGIQGLVRHDMIYEKLIKTIGGKHGKEKRTRLNVVDLIKRTKVEENKEKRKWLFLVKMEDIIIYKVLKEKVG